MMKLDGIEVKSERDNDSRQSEKDTQATPLK
jgi:hypothetical protein